MATTSTKQPKLTGFLRFQIKREWLRRGKPGDGEAFVKAVCDAKGIRYTKPTPIKRR